MKLTEMVEIRERDLHISFTNRRLGICSSGVFEFEGGRERGAGCFDIDAVKDLVRPVASLSVDFQGSFPDSFVL